MQPSKADPLCTYSRVLVLIIPRLTLLLPFQQIAAFQLIEAGKLHLDTPVASIVPELANPVVLDPDRSGTDRLGYRPAEQEMRIRHLLNHSSGMMYRPENGFVPYSTTYGEENPVGQFYDILKVSEVMLGNRCVRDLLKGDYPGVPLQHEPGTSCTYLLVAAPLYEPLS